MTPHVLSYGELLVDFSQHGMGPLGYPAYEALPGGGVANMVVALARWGHPTAFAGRIGADALGGLLKKTLEDEGVDIASLKASSKPTTMAIVSLDAHGDRSFDFLWQGTSCDGLPVVQPDPARLPKIFHFSSVSMCGPEGRRNNLESVRQHKAAGCWISFDPNLRETLWPDLNTARDAIREGLTLSDVVKISEEEAAFVLGEPQGDPRDQARRLFDQFRPSLLFVTQGPQGCLWLNATGSGHCAAPRVAVVDTTGAGDCFMAGILHTLLETGRAPGDLTPTQVSTLAAFGVAAGSASTTRRGGIPSLPKLSTVNELLNRP
jgi:fructokinase